MRSDINSVRRSAPPAHSPAGLPWALLPLVALLAVACLAVPSPLAAQPQAAPGSPANDGSVAYHVVRPGDTLRDIAERYLGRSSRWPELVRANPRVENPDTIEPGWRLAVPVDREVPEATARVTTVSRQVEEKPDPTPWREALRGDLLRERDALRTYDDSSAALAFPDGESLLINEDSLIFLRVVDERLRPRRSGSIEIVDGQADLEARPRAAARSAPRDVEILLGPARAAVRPGDDGSVQTRARKPEAGGAQMMVYAGGSALEAAGETVELEAGTGSVVPENGPPGPPEPLLSAPVLVRPAADARLGFSNPTFEWRPVDDAASYTLELCADPRCAELLVRRTGLDGTRLNLEQPPASLHWRVTATAASGLDGYPSAARPLTLAGEGPDRDAPRGEVTIDGAHLRVGETLVLGPASTLGLDNDDELAGVDSVAWFLDDEPVEAEAWSGDWGGGAHTVSAVITDRAGNEIEIGPLRFLHDIETPSITVELGEDELLERRGATRFERRRDLFSERWARDPDHDDPDPPAVVAWSSDGLRWLPLGPTPRAASITSEEPWDSVVQGAEAQVFLRTVGRGELAVARATGEDAGEGEELVMDRDDLLHLEAEDRGGAGLAELRFRIDAAEAGTPEWVLVVEAEDAVGNRTRLEWTIERR